MSSFFKLTIIIIIIIVIIIIIMTTIHTRLALTEAVFLCEALDAVGGVGPHGEQADHGGARHALLPHLLHVQDDALGEALAQGVCDVPLGLGQRAVGAPGTHQQQTAEHVQVAVVAVRDDLLLRRVLVEPLPPLLLVAGHLWTGMHQPGGQHGGGGEGM